MATMITHTRLSTTARMHRYQGFEALQYRASHPDAQLMMMEGGRARPVAYAEAVGHYEAHRERMLERVFLVVVRTN